VGKGEGCEEITEEKEIVPRPNDGLGFFVSVYLGISPRLSGYLDARPKVVRHKSRTDTDFLRT